MSANQQTRSIEISSHIMSPGAKHVMGHDCRERHRHG
jgi:hypothetical protein